jgi:uncharacterized protein (TIGR03790 family)
MKQAGRSIRGICLGLLLPWSITACDSAPNPADDSTVSASAFGPEQLGVIVNDADPSSQHIAKYYVKQRRIPAGNVIHTSFRPGDSIMRPEDFQDIKSEVDRQTPAAVQAYALTWTVPYRVGCMSITSAFAAGFDADFCALGCKPTRPSPYFNSRSRRPHTDFGWRPTIMLAGTRASDVEALIDRGIEADGSNPAGTAYLLSTNDRQRNTRARFYPGIRLLQSDRFRIEIIDANSLHYRDDVMFYFTGLARVAAIDTNHFLPGAIADHLTSTGGRLTDSRQMSSLRWLEAGATGSYGTVAEPCNFVQKFPRPNLVIDTYLNGETLIESYWKSVEWPGQGVFIGEPLATPFLPVSAQQPGGAMTDTESRETIPDSGSSFATPDNANMRYAASRGSGFVLHDSYRQSRLDRAPKMPPGRID